MVRDADRTIPDTAREVGARLAELFARDQQLVKALNEAQRRLLDANEQLTAGLSAEALQAIYGPAGPDAGLSGRRPPVLEAEQPIGALEDVADAIGRGFVDYQRLAEGRRRLAVDVGEATGRLVAAMTAAGFTADEARRADVAALADGTYRPGPRERPDARRARTAAAVRDRALAALLSIDSAGDLAAACPDIGPYADPADWRDPAAEERLAWALAARARAARCELLAVVAELAHGGHRHAVLAEALDLEPVAIDRMLNELAAAQADDLLHRETLARLMHQRTRDPEDCDG